MPCPGCTRDEDPIRDEGVLVNLAGQISHVDSMTDLAINVTAQLSILQACLQEPWSRTCSPASGKSMESAITCRSMNACPFASWRKPHRKPHRLNVNYNRKRSSQTEFLHRAEELGVVFAA